ncbi:MAG TPA: helicase-related protein, partial [Candidatus Norongarragalinales archaeon]|nr:helicase-related protein [Candidatus Norongarragalinales archaeon]
LEAQGVSALLSFLSGMKERKEKTKAVLALLEDFRIQKLIAQSDDLLSKGISHPKVERLKRIVAEQARDGKALIVFAHFKDTVASLIAHLNSLPGISAKAMVGTSGMSQKKQKALLDDFREKKFNVLVCTSVGEEGLDIPAVDTVIFYEAVPSEIRHIQRRGRAGRIRAGNAIVLVAKNTKDEAFFWIARRKERAMRQVLEEYSRDLSEARNAGKDAQKNLKEF